LRSKRLADLCISPDRSIRDAIACIDRNEKGIVLVVDVEQRLLGTISDGDVRRAMLAKESLDTPVSELLVRKDTSPYPKPVTAPSGTDRAVLLELMQDRVVRQVPLLDECGCVVDLVTWDDLLPDQVLPLQAVVMAGGRGTRLRPLTEAVPKPMLSVGGRPLLERIVNQLREAGIRRVNIATHYLSEKIVDHFGDGHDFGVELNYVTEDSPLGTAGALGLMQTPKEPLLVINGDILTQVNFRAMLAYHREHRAILTVAVREYDLNVPYGVLRCEGPIIREIVEKPALSFFVNAGIYLLEPEVHRYIPNRKHFDMTHLIQTLIDEGKPVIGFPILEYWLDVGYLDDYTQAQKDIQDERFAS